MNIRKPIDYSAMYAGLAQALGRNLPQMELYLKIGKLVSARKEKGAAVAAAEYLAVKCPDNSGFSPRNLRRMRDFFRTYETAPDILKEPLLIGWTLNVVIMEADLSLDQRHWYLRAVSQFGWSKAELLRQISDSAHEKMNLDVLSGTCYTDSDQPRQDDEDSFCVSRQDQDLSLKTLAISAFSSQKRRIYATFTPENNAIWSPDKSPRSDRFYRSDLGLLNRM